MEFGAKEGIEYASLSVRIHALSVVRDSEGNIVSYLCLDRYYSVMVVFRLKAVPANSNLDMACGPLRNRFRSVDHEVHHDLLELCRVGLHQREILVQFQRKLHHLGDTGGQERH